MCNLVTAAAGPFLRFHGFMHPIQHLYEADCAHPDRVVTLRPFRLRAFFHCILTSASPMLAKLLSYTSFTGTNSLPAPTGGKRGTGRAMGEGPMRAQP